MNKAHIGNVEEPFIVNPIDHWECVTVYGDTDSLFVYFEGVSKDKAFDLANEIAEVISSINPDPVKLKFEKIYQPAILLAKKRYFGFKFEKKTEVQEVFEAKGIETIRRDNCPVVQKMMENVISIITTPSLPFYSVKIEFFSAQET